jgi:hypothetical protein
MCSLPRAVALIPIRHEFLYIYGKIYHINHINNHLGIDEDELALSMWRRSLNNDGGPIYSLNLGYFLCNL